MLNQLAEYFQKMFQGSNEPKTRGSELEAYIVKHSPQTTCDVERLIRQFDMRQSDKGWSV